MTIRNITMRFARDEVRALRYAFDRSEYDN